MTITARARQLTPSATLAISARARQLQAEGIDVISFGSGEPDFDTPAHIKAAAVQALHEGFTKYTATDGINELKDSIRAKLKRVSGLDYARDEIIVSCGGKHSLYNIAQVLFEPGDEIMIPSPYWVTYPEQVKLSEAHPVVVPTDEADGFVLRAKAVAAAVTPRTKALILDSPNNPTGAVVPRDELKGLARLALERGFWVISDECYEDLVYDGVEYASIATLAPEMRERTVLVYTMSKSYAMTGWRIGYAAGPRQAIRAMATFQSQVTSNPTSIAQRAAAVALTGPQDSVRMMAGEFDRRRRYIVGRLQAMPGVRCAVPQGAFYAFPNVSGLFGRSWKGGRLGGSKDVCEFLVSEARIAVVPGIDFGSDRHVRFSYATSFEAIAEGMDRMASAIAALG
ncbi:MAG TPA: pyridoxal phosphate-dependent aminotransferase [Candidatus Methylomirabilis sp.]